MPAFTKEYEIHYFEIDQSREVTPISLLHFMEDSAISHSEAVGLGIDRLLTAGTCWVLNHWWLKMNRYPRLGDKISIHTWPSKFERFYAQREFDIEDGRENSLGQASSLWIYLNLYKKRPLRIPGSFSQVYGLTEKSLMNGTFSDLPEMTSVQPGMRFHVRHSDIDTNGHVNNARYVEWMIEGIGTDLSPDYRLAELEVKYIKETVYGTDIYSEHQAMDTINPEYLHRIMDKTGDHQLARGRTVWKKRPRLNGC